VPGGVSRIARSPPRLRHHALSSPWGVGLSSKKVMQLLVLRKIYGWAQALSIFGSGGCFHRKTQRRSLKERSQNFEKTVLDAQKRNPLEEVRHA